MNPPPPFSTALNNAGLDSRDPATSADLRKRGFVVLHEGKTFRQFTDHWQDRPPYVIPLSNLLDKPSVLQNACHFRLAYRAISASTNERTAISNLHPPSVTTQNQNPTEQLIAKRPHNRALEVLAIANSYCFDFGLRLFVSSSTVNYFFLARAPFPKLQPNRQLLIHSALRLTCNHAGYEPLWREQVGDVWREAGKEPFTWPVLAGDDERWAVRAAIDAVVAEAYGLSREQYAHVLSTFSHASYPAAPTLCLAAFDELKQLGLAAFTQKHDPYHDIPSTNPSQSPSSTCRFPPIPPARIVTAFS